jgi:hypothetical protein
MALPFRILTRMFPGLRPHFDVFASWFSAFSGRSPRKENDRYGKAKPFLEANTGGQSRELEPQHFEAKRN